MAAHIGKQDSFPGPEWLIQAFLRDLPRLDIFVYLHPGSQTIKTHLLRWKVGHENTEGMLMTHAHVFTHALTHSHTLRYTHTHVLLHCRITRKIKSHICRRL